MIDVSIVIVCMNNLENLYPCLDSIKKFTTKVSYETLVVAYLFSKENLEKVKEDFPWVIILESDEIRGFSENNNLALRQAKGKYCFVLNDDTEMKMPVIDRLVETLEGLPKDVAILSPKILLTRSHSAILGKPKFDFITFVMDELRLTQLYYNKSPYVNQYGVFRTYNISGAAFLISTKLFKEVGFFDEKYFFCPEDIALSTKINEMGMKCYVDSDIEINHYSGGTWSKTIMATKPATVKGCFYFFCGNNVIKRVFYIFILCFSHFFKMMYWFLRNIYKKDIKNDIMLKANVNALYALFSTKTPKELFIHFYMS